MYNLQRFGFSDLMSCRAELRTKVEMPAATVAESAGRIARFFYESLVDDAGKPACALVRVFKTHRFADLDDELKAFSRKIYPPADRERDLRCLVLVATAGDLPEWNDPAQSQGHRAIPLSSEEVVAKAPMISQLIEQFGVKISAVVRPNPELVLEGGPAKFNVFYVPEALGSPYIVAQEEFVARYGVKSVVGVGGLLVTGDLFATILFSKVPISAETADAFRILGLNLKLAFLALVEKPLFAAKS
jgi:hypothetical protein